MPKRIYPGPSGGVDLTLPDGSTLHCPRGEAVEIPAELVDGLQGFETPRQADAGPTVPELRQQLKDLGVQIPAKAVKADLQQLIDQATAPAADEPAAAEQTPQGDNPDETPLEGDDPAPDDSAPAEKE